MRFKFESSIVFYQMPLVLVLALFGGISVQAQCSPEQTFKLLADDAEVVDTLSASSVKVMDVASGLVASKCPSMTVYVPV